MTFRDDIAPILMLAAFWLAPWVVGLPIVLVGFDRLGWMVITLGCIAVSVFMFRHRPRPPYDRI